MGWMRLLVEIENAIRLTEDYQMEIKSKIEKLNETKFHFAVALYHLRAMHSEVIPTKAIDTWKELLRYGELMDHVFTELKQ